MLRASRPSETHALAVQTLPAEPAAAGPPLQPQTHDAASAITPSATAQIRLATANHPALPAAWQSCEATPLTWSAGGPVPPGMHSAVCQEWPRLKYLPKPCPQVMSDDRRLIVRRNASHPLADGRPHPPGALPLNLRHPRSAACRCLRPDGKGQAGLRA